MHLSTLGHEAGGSLLSYLRDQGWAAGCSAGVGEEGMEFASSHALFSISFVLSESGLKHWREIVTATYAYIAMLRWYSSSSESPGWPEWIYEELKQLEEVSHQYSDEEAPDDLVESLAEEMPPAYLLPPERLLDGSIFPDSSTLTDFSHYCDSLYGMGIHCLYGIHSTRLLVWRPRSVGATFCRTTFIPIVRGTRITIGRIRVSAQQK